MRPIEFGKWLPDQPSIQGPHLRDAKNVTPTVTAYSPWKALAAATTALDGRCLGFCAAKAADGDSHVYAGDSEKLYELQGTTFSDVSAAGGYGPQVTATRWRFTVYGDRLIATNAIDPPQYIDMSTGSAFADLPGSPGNAYHVAVFGEFVFMAPTANSKSVKWSGLGDSEGWTAGVNQSDEQELADGGSVTGFVATNTVLYVFKETCVYRFLYVGGDVIFQIDKVLDGIGCIEAGSLVSYGTLMLFLDESGWFLWDGSSQPRPIGAETFDTWFQGEAKTSSRYSMSSALDSRRKLAVWAFASNDSAQAVPDTLLVYNYAGDKATYIKADVEMIGGGLSLGVGMDDMTTFVMDDETDIAMDDPSWFGGNAYFGGFTTAHKMGSFSGDNLEATLETGAFPIMDGSRARIEWLRPMFTGDSSGAVTAAGGSAVRAGDAITFQSAVSQQASGRCPQRNVNGFYCAAKYVAPAAAAWTSAIGHEFKASPAGAR